MEGHIILTMIGSDVIGPTGIGTGTTKTQLGGAALVMPAWARAILAVRPTLVTETPTLDESVMAHLTLESDDFSIQPYLALCNPIMPASNIGLNTGCLFVGEAPWYPVNCPINGGDRLKVYGTALLGNSAEPLMSCEVIVSDKKPGAQLHAKIGTLTSTGVAPSVNVVEASYTLTGGKTLKELLAFIGLGVTADVDTIIGRFEFISNDLENPTPLKLMGNPINAGLLPATGGGAFSTPGLARARVDVPIRSPCQFTNNLQLANTPGAAGKFITGVLYE